MTTSSSSSHQPDSDDGSDDPKSVIRERVLEIFECVRETPGAEFERARLFNYLSAPRSGVWRLRDLVNLKHSPNRFRERIQDEFAVCFSNKDLDRMKGLEQIVDRVAYLQETPKSSLAVINHRLKEPLEPGPVILVAFLSFPLVGFSFALLGNWGLISLIIPAVLLLFLVRLHRRDRRYHEALRIKVLEARDRRQCRR